MALSEVVVISVTCSVTFLLSLLLVTIICLHFRQRRTPNSNVLLDPEFYPQSRGLFRTSAAFPYSSVRQAQWSEIGSMENMQDNASGGIQEPPPCHLSDGRFSRMSSSSTRNSRRLQKRPTRDIQLARMQPRPARVAPSVSESIDSLPPNVAELQAENTPKQTPELPQNGSNAEASSSRITSWPPATASRSYNDITATARAELRGDSKLAKQRSEGILNQAPGSPPRQPVPPLPAVPPSGISHLPTHDSMLISNKSLDTAGSSILDDPIGDNPNNLEATRGQTLRAQDRYAPAAGWVPASTGSGSVSRIPQAMSPRRYSLTSAGSHKPSEEFSSPRRSASIHYPERSTYNWGMQSSTSHHPPYVPPSGLSRSLTSGPLNQNNMHGQTRQPPPVCGLNQHSRNQHTGPVVSTSMLETGRNSGTGQQVSTANNGGASIGARGSTSPQPTPPMKPPAERYRKGHRRQSSVRMSISQQNPNQTSLPPTIEEPEDASRQSTPKLKAANEVPGGKASFGIDSAADNPFDSVDKKSEQDKADKSTPTPIQRDLKSGGLVTASSSDDSKSSKALTVEKPVEKPNIPRRSPLRRNSTGAKSPQYQSTRSATLIPTTTTATGHSRHHSTSATTPSSIPRSISLKHHTNSTPKVDKEEKDSCGGDRPVKTNACASRTSPKQMDTDTEVSDATKPRPLPILPPAMPLSPAFNQLPRPPKFRGALTTIESVSNIAAPEEVVTGGSGSENLNNKENDGNDSGKDDDDSNGTMTPRASRFHYRHVAREGGVEAQDLQNETPRGKPEFTTPLKEGAEQTVPSSSSSLLTTPGSIYDQYGFLKE
ncbi:hypothetical protein AJ79_01861 [Helicocarpus griseus UAMH5409]|uniref:Uncharacterized protein n=1 Tax=Helicocarpus griseus UAMH5409 TaxID=1447875 RepID=A0A2B7Y5B2_9EURO|nr:hypothetical protein AJ79_01861 [Helicocarpus griseus UAMH5409]